MRAGNGSLDAEKTRLQCRLTVSKRFETEKTIFQCRLRVRPWPLEAKSATANRKISVQVEGFEVARLILKNQDYSAGSRVLQWPLEPKSATANRKISVQVAGFEVARSRQEKSETPLISCDIRWQV